MTVQLLFLGYRNRPRALVDAPVLTQIILGKGASFADRVAVA